MDRVFRRPGRILSWPSGIASGSCPNGSRGGSARSSCRSSSRRCSSSCCSAWSWRIGGSSSSRAWLRPFGRRLYHPGLLPAAAGRGHRVCRLSRDRACQRLPVRGRPAGPHGLRARTWPGRPSTPMSATPIAWGAAGRLRTDLGGVYFNVVDHSDHDGCLRRDPQPPGAAAAGRHRAHGDRPSAAAGRAP